MTVVECRTKKIGGSIGVILPKDLIKKEGIKSDQNIEIEIINRPKAREIWGLFPNWKTPTQKLKDEARKGW